MAWDAKKQEWRPIIKTTKTSDSAKALTIARQFETFAQQAAGAAQSGDRLSREHISGIINTILSVAGLPQYVETRQWDEYSLEWLGLQSTRIEARSLESYEGHVRMLTRWFGEAKNSPINTIDGSILQDWYFDMIDEGRKPATVNNAVKTVQAVFDRARAEGFCQRNPAELILRQYGEADIRQPFTAEDLEKILSHLRLHSVVPSTEKNAVLRSAANSSMDWLTVALLGICTGQRLQDCTTATWSDFTAATKKNPRVWHNKQTKGGKLVHIPIIDPLESHLQTLQARPGKPLAPSLAGLPTGGTRGLSEQFSLILDAAGVKREKREKKDGSKGQSWTDKTFHSFRHTTNTLLAEADMPYEVRKDITGHSSSAMNERYTHRAASTLADVLQRAITDTIAP